MSLKSILKEIETNRPNAEMVVETGNPLTLGGRTGLKRAAVEATKRLRTDYRNALLTQTAFILVTGPHRNEFSELASNENFGCFSADPEEFFKDLTSKISPTLFGREGTRQLFNIAGRILEDKMGDLDIGSYPMLAFSEKYNSSSATPSDFTALIRNAIVDQVGSELVGINAVHSIVDSAIAKNHSDPVTPVVLNTSDEKFALDLQKNLKRLTSRVFLVSAGKSESLKNNKDVMTVKKVSEETVGEVLSNIRNKIL
jgi:hypothetical protein